MSTMESAISTTQPMSAQMVDHQNVRISHVMCDSSQVPRASLRFTYATITPTMPTKVSSGAGTTSPELATCSSAATANRMYATSAAVTGGWCAVAGAGAT